MRKGTVIIMINWTPDQEKAISLRDGSMLLSAAAGSGKTAVLVERVIGRICDSENPCGLDELLVVTFTNAAASEMKAKISKTLAELISKRPGDIHLRKQQMLLPKAQISTVSSFCGDLVREHFEQLRLPPDLRTLDDKESGMLKGEILNEVLTECFETDSDNSFFELSESVNRGKNEKALSGHILDLHSFILAHPFPHKWLDSQLERYDPDVRIEESEWGRIINEYTAEYVKHALCLISPVLEHLESDTDADKKYGKALGGYFEVFTALDELLSHGVWDDIRELTGVKISHVGNSAFDNETVKRKLDGVVQELKDIWVKIEDLYSISSAEHKDDISVLRPVAGKLFECVKLFDSRYGEKKAENGLVDFSDMEHFAINLLVTETADGYEETCLAKRLRETYKEVLVDEYQDTNEAQDMIFRAISRNETNLFTVGDVKQSIYSFRQAMPEIFLKRSERYNPANGGQVTYPVRLTLSNNFRSREGVTDAVNFVFSLIMTEETGEINYGRDERLEAAARYPGSEYPAAETMITAVDDEEKDEAEAASIAEKIKEIVAQTEFEYRDITILTRSVKGHADTYISVFKRYGIPLTAELDVDFFTLPEIESVMSLLRVIANPMLDIPLLAVMMSPFFGFTPDDTAVVSMNGQKRLYLNLLKAAESGHEKSSKFIKLTERWRKLAAVLPSDELLNRVYEEGSICAAVEAMKNGGIRVKNLRVLLGRARTYEKTGSKGIHAFLRYIERIEEQGGGFDSAPPASDAQNMVRMMTIHKSKGLEFPVCFVAGLGRKFNRKSLSGAMLADAHLGVAFKRRSPDGAVEFNTTPRKALAIGMESKMLAEELRVLYVAMTRAKERLILSVAVKDLPQRLSRAAGAAMDAQKIPPIYIRRSDGFADLLFMCMLRHRDGAELRKIAGIDDSAVMPSGQPWNIYIAESAGEQPEVSGSDISAQPDENVIERLMELSKYTYPYAPLKKIVAKVSASALSKKASPAEFIAAKRPAFMSKSGLTGAQAGTAIHKFMEKAVFEAPGFDAIEHLNSLVSRGFLTELDAQSIDIGKINAFLGSELAERIRLSPFVSREHRFTVNIGAAALDDSLLGDFADEPVILQGVIDLIFKEDGELVVVDYKTDRISDSKTLSEHYGKQVELYSRAAEQCFGKAVKQKILYSFHLNREIEV